MARLPLTSLSLAVIAALALVAGGCSTTWAPREASRGWALTHPGAAGGADIGPLTDAQGRRRSLALAPHATYADAGPDPYAARNDSHRSVTAGFAGPTTHTAQTRTVDRGPGGGSRFFGRSNAALRDGFSTRTVRRSFSESVR